MNGSVNEPSDQFVLDDPYPTEEEQPTAGNTLAEDDSAPVDENGSSPAALWHGLIGSVLGLGLVPGGAELLRMALVSSRHLSNWGAALALLIALNAGVYWLLWRRVSAVCALSFAVCAVFSLIPAVAILSQVVSLDTPL